MFATETQDITCYYSIFSCSNGYLFPTCSYNMKKIKVGKVSFILLLNTLATTTKESCQLLFKQLFWSVLKITKNLLIIAFEKAWSLFIELKSGHVTPKHWQKQTQKNALLVVQQIGSSKNTLLKSSESSKSDIVATVI